MNYLGIDLGGTNIEIGIVNSENIIIYTSTFKTASFSSAQDCSQAIYDDLKEHFDKNFKGKSAKEIDALINGMDLSVYDGVRYMNNREREHCQTVPKGYTDTLTQNEAACILGDGWTVDVIAHIFKNIPLT